jgi:hypothetical protein
LNFLFLNFITGGRTEDGKWTCRRGICAEKKPVFQYKSYYVRHVENVHEKKRERYICSKCNKDLLLSSKREHEIRHQKEKPFKCLKRLCKRSKDGFKLKKDLDAHMKTHDPKCSNCNRGCPQGAKCIGCGQVLPKRKQPPKKD